MDQKPRDHAPKQIESIVLLAMLGLQLSWLAALWVSGASTTWQVPLVFVGSIVVTGIVWVFLRGEIGRISPAIPFILLAVVGALYLTQQRVWPFDEEWSLVSARLVAAEGADALLRQYTDIPWLGHTHPPLIVLLNGYAMRVISDGIWVPRLLTLLFAGGTVAATIALGQTLYSRRLGIVAGLILLTFPLFVRLGTAAMLDVQATFFATLTIYCLVQLDQTGNWVAALALGVALGLGMLTKYTVALIGPAMIVYLLLFSTWRTQFVKLAAAAALALVLFASWLFVAHPYGILSQQQQFLTRFAAIAQRAAEPLGNVLGAETTTNQSADSDEAALSADADDGLNTATRFVLESLFTRLPSAIGVYLIPLGAIGVWVSVTQRTRTEWFLLLWIVLVWAILIATLPDHRYFMISFPAIAIIVTRGLLWLNSRAALLLALFFCSGALLIFVNWSRGAHLFIN